MKTFGTGLSALVLACLVLVGVSPQPVSAEFSQCKDFPYQYSFTGVEGYGIAVPQRYGVRAYVDVSSGYFGPCTEGGGFDSASAWVSMEPHPSAPEGNNTWAILQIGLINCNNPAWTACNGQALHAFWARGGCNNNAPEPYDLGVTDASVHEFAVKKNLTSETYILTMDGGAFVKMRGNSFRQLD